MKKIIILLLLFMTNEAFSQFCENFNIYSPETYTNSSAQIQHNVLDDWGSLCSTVEYSDGGYNGQGDIFLKLTDQPCGNTSSWVFDSTNFSGNWIDGLQFSFDFRLFDGGQTTSTTESIYIYDGSDPQNSNLVAKYVLNTPISTSDGWVSIVPYIALMNQGNLPSSIGGYWEMVVGSDWDNLIQNVQGIAFLIDLNEGAEVFGIDNICMQECDEWPFDHIEEGELFTDFPLCYDEVPYVTSIDLFLGYVYNITINGATIMSFDPFYIDPNYLNLEEGTLTLDSPGEYVLELFTGDCTVSFELVIAPEIIIDLPSTYVACDGVFEEICPPGGSDYTYQWYGPEPNGDQSILLDTEECFTPNQVGSYNLVVTDEYGCTNNHHFTVLEEIPVPTLNDCIGEIMSIDALIYNNPNYEISWFHNHNLVQTGGTTLTSSYTSGTITVQIAYGGCPPVSTSVTLRPCCPDDLFLSIDCETQQISIENFPTNLPGLKISSWTFNGEPINPQGIFSSTFNTIYGSGVYGVSVLIMFPGGEECRFEQTIVYREEDCCDQGLGPIANAQFVNIDGYESFNTDPHGYVEIPVLCDFMLNASSSICEEEYIISIAELEPVSWATNQIFPWTAFSGQAGMIDLSNFASFQAGQAYLLTLHAGPNGTTIDLPFIYGLDAELTVANQNVDYISLMDTKYGHFEVPIIRCQRLILDGSASSCEDEYRITITSFDPVFPNWNFTDPNTNPPGSGTIHNVVYSGQAPSSIIIPMSLFENGQYPTGYYHITLSVGPTWTAADHELIWYEKCDNLIGDAHPPSMSMDDANLLEGQISIYPNPADNLVTLGTSFESGNYDLIDLNGTVVKHGVLSAKETTIDLTGVHPGIYFFRLLDEEENVYFKKVIKN